MSGREAAALESPRPDRLAPVLAPAVPGKAQQAVPGITVMFAFFAVGNVGFAFFREHGWNTWERLRASAASPAQIMAGKVVVPLVQAALQLAVLFGLGGLLFGMHVRGPLVGLLVVAAPLVCCLVGLGLMLVALCRTVTQLNMFTNVGSLVIAGVGGAITPTATLPGWAQSIAPATPGYWAMRGFRQVVIAGSGPGAVASDAVILLGFAVVFVVVAALRFRMAETKTSWA